MNKEKVFEYVMIILGCIMSVIIAWLLFYLSSTPRKVDCDKYNKVGTGYVAVPKQCEKGEK